MLSDKTFRCGKDCGGRRRVRETVRQSMDDPLETACKWAASQHTRISSFGVCRSSAEGRYIVAECATLEEAREVARKSSEGDFGHNVVVIALTPEGWVYELEKFALK